MPAASSRNGTQPRVITAGIIVDACRRLLEVQPRAAGAPRMPATKLID